MAIEISVLLPATSPKYLGVALQSIAEQSINHELLEIILVIDGMERNLVTSLVPEKLQSRTKIVASPASGIVPALNQGVLQCTGKYIARMDHDDVMLPRRLETQYLFLEKHPEVSIVGGQTYYINSNGERISRQRYPKSNERIKRFLPYINTFSHPAVMIRSKSLANVASYRLNIPEDWDLWCRLLQQHKGQNLSEFVLEYRLHDSQLSRTDLYSSIETPIKIRYLNHLLSKNRNVEEIEVFTQKNWVEKIMKNNPELSSIFHRSFPLELRIYLYLLRIDRAGYKISLRLLQKINKIKDFLRLEILEEPHK